MPDTPGQCTVTRISEVSTRFGDPVSDTNADEGIVISYENGGSQVDYDRPWRLNDLKPGQKVVLCLMDIPHDCPQGDTRGRLYYGFDADTGFGWLMPDSQHMCGGACIGAVASF